MAAVQYHEGQFPPEGLDWQRLIPRIGPTAAAVARYDGMLAAIPNPDLLLSPLTMQEAVLSSRIEGTQATMGEVLEFEAGQRAASPERRDDIQEVLNYRAAMHRSEEMLKELPISQRVIREAHRVLLDGVRGTHKAPGEYRRVPNWIGPPGCTMSDATFVPVGADKLPKAMDQWERYVHQDDSDRLVQLAVLHAEFEALHPFLDGNGRLGRMLVTLLMWHFDLITQPKFYVSAYFEANRNAYYEGLLAVSRDNDWTGWCQFFLDAVRKQAEDNLAKAKGILDLYGHMKIKIANLTRSRYAIHALDWIFGHPIFQSSQFVRETEIPARTARRIIDTLCEGDVLEVILASRGRRTTVLSFSSLLHVVENGTIIGNNS